MSTATFRKAEGKKSRLIGKGYGDYLWGLAV